VLSGRSHGCRHQAEPAELVRSGVEGSRASTGCGSGAGLRQLRESGCQAFGELSCLAGAAIRIDGRLVGHTNTAATAPAAISGTRSGIPKR
jgi:hypothetical protein